MQILSNSQFAVALPGDQKWGRGVQPTFESAGARVTAAPFSWALASNTLLTKINFIHALPRLLIDSSVKGRLKVVNCLDTRVVRAARWKVMPIQMKSSTKFIQRNGFKGIDLI